MLHPNSRNLYTDALTPPPGYIFDHAIGTTYTLDPLTLLTIPVHLGLAVRRRGTNPDSIDFLGALRQVADRITVYVQRGRMQVPHGENVLFSLLESMVVEVVSPGGGAFHPKIWVLRFTDTEGAKPILRLLVLSRNLTFDRSWDLCLQLEGQPRRKKVANQPIADFIRDLPLFSINGVDDKKRIQAKNLADEVESAEWMLPENFDEVRFHVIRNQPWRPAKSERLAVVSPFVTDLALKALVETTELAEALVSRGEEIDTLGNDPHKIFHEVLVLNDAAESEDGEDVSKHDMLGLHAKVFITEKGNKTRLYVGSANATTPALINGKNVEVLAELVGYWAGGINAFLGEAGIRKYVVDWVKSEPVEQSEEEQLAGKILDRVSQALANAQLRVGCVVTTSGDTWQLELRGNTTLDLDGVQTIRAWPITVSDSHSTNIHGLMGNKSISLGVYSPQSITGLIAFEITSELASLKARFTLNFPLDNPPEERETSLLQVILNNHEGFLRYLLLLLGEFGEGLRSNVGGEEGGANGQWSAMGEDTLPLLEEMTRAFSRDPARLHEIRGIVERLESSVHGAKIVPEKFRILWPIFEKALSEERR